MKIVGKILKISLRVLLIATVLVTLLGLIIAFFIERGVDYEADEELFRAAGRTSVTRLFADSGEGDAYTPVEIEATAFGAAKKVWYPLSEISDYLKNGFIAVEDREFYSHGGVNLRRTFGAFLNYAFGDGERYGASTITQQVVKNISGDNEISAKRKLYEIMRARGIEKRHTKDEILELYLNIVPMSENIAGVGFAADRYFGKEPSELTLSEAAAIVGITNSPVKYDPRKNPEACKERRGVVLSAMLDMGFISEDEFREADESELSLVEEEDGGVSSWFVETVLEEVVRDLAAKNSLSEAAARLMLLLGGYRIYTTEDVRVQETLERIFENDEYLPSEISDGLGAAMCVCDSESGVLLGIVGAAGKKQGSRLLNLAEVPHPPASTLKPLALYAPLIDSGEINWASVFDDVPTEFKKSGDGYTPFPRNSPDVYAGLITVKDALRLSKNTVAVKLYEKLGAERIFKLLHDGFGFDTLTRGAEGASGRVSDLGIAPLALGQLSFGVPLRRLVEAYTVFASEGVLTKGRSYYYVEDADGNRILENEGQPKRIFSVGTARVMNQLLMNVTADGTGRKITLKDTVDTAGKTGTSSGEYDKLFVGYTPYVTAGIWYGYPEGNRPVGRPSVSHLELWDRVMNEIHRNFDLEKHFSTEGLVVRDYCKDSGEMPDAACSLDVRGDRLERGWFTPDNLPTERCKRHVVCPYDTLTEALASEGCDGETVVPISLIDVPWRAFPTEIFVTDAEYVYRKVPEGVPLGDSYDVPFFIHALPEGVFVGKGRNKKQFNSACYLHAPS